MFLRYVVEDIIELLMKYHKNLKQHEGQLLKMQRKQGLFCWIYLFISTVLTLDEIPIFMETCVTFIDYEFIHLQCFLYR